MFPLPGLALDDDAAVKLFVHCARRQDARFRPNAESLAAVRAICTTVAGIPLAIQLTATWIPLMPPAQILAEIERDIDFVAADLHDLPDRHRSLRAVFDHAARRLSDAEHRLLARLAIFDGEFGYEAAVAVAEARPAMLLQLVNRSLVEQIESGRYRIYPPLRPFASELPAANGAVAAETRSRLANYILELLVGSEGRLISAEEVTLTRIETAFHHIQTIWPLLTAAQLDRALPALDRFLTITTRTHAGVRPLCGRR